jgi:hypothetical protein
VELVLEQWWSLLVELVLEQWWSLLVELELVQWWSLLVELELVQWWFLLVELVLVQWWLQRWFGFRWLVLGFDHHQFESRLGLQLQWMQERVLRR